MTLDEQIIACAIDNGYDGSVPDTLSLDSNAFSPHRPHRKVNKWCIYYVTGDKDNPDGIFVWTVTDKKLKQWQRDYKLKQIGL
jgi:hypothetical protein